jgi:hypothetical protein
MKFLQEMICICVLFFATMPVFAQQKTVHAENAVGKISGNQAAVCFKRIDARKNLDRTKAASLKKCVASQLKIFFSDPLLNPPKGFEVKTDFGISKDPFAKNILFPACSFLFNFYYLNKDDQTGATKVSMDGTSIGMETNAEDHFFRQVGNFWEDCSKTNFLLFFEHPPITESTADYIELDFKKYGFAAIAPKKPFRIVKRNDKPLFTPLSRKEFLQFLIAQKKYQIREDEQNIPDLQKSIKESQETLKNPPSYLTEDVKKALANGVVTIQKNIGEVKEKIKEKRQKIKEYESMITAMSAEEAASPARLDENKSTPDFDDLKRLVPFGRMEGVGLYKINPNYYDRSPGAPGAQLIFVYYHLPQLGGIENTELNYLEKKTVNIFNGINYHQLKESMK